MQADAGDILAVERGHRAIDDKPDRRARRGAFSSGKAAQPPPIPDQALHLVRHQPKDRMIENSLGPGVDPHRLRAKGLFVRG